MFPENRTVLLVKTETAYGVNSNPAAAVNAILTKGLPGFKIAGSKKMREVTKPWMGTIAGVNVGEGISINFTTELRGSGTMGVATRLSPLFRSANLTEAISGDVLYIPNSVFEGESCTIYFHHNGSKHAITGAVVSSMKITAKTNEIITIDWELTGLYSSAAVSIATWPTGITYGDNGSPIIFRDASFTFNSNSSLVIDGFEFSFTNTVSKRTNANAATGIDRYYISDREVKGSFDPEVPALGDFNPYTLFENSTVGLCSLNLGQTTGNKLNIAFPKIQIDVPDLASREKALTYGISFTAHTDLTTGNNEFVMTFEES